MSRGCLCNEMLAVLFKYFRLLSTRFLELTVATFNFSGTIEPQEEEQYVGVEPVYEEERDQGHFAEQGKPPHHTLLKSYYFI